MPCPHCGEPNDYKVIPSVARSNMNHYGKSVLIATLCCQKPVRVYPVQSYRVEASNTSEPQDDWGNPFKGVDKGK